ncbi:hypothetical protein Sm713_78660 [Streptomyces sp. TS71-3]|nr:hypothetical protein Sm713_78660 [Streptomyces sp. TS71-3]
MIKGIDVSDYQGTGFSTSGLDFVIVKATEGRSYINPKQAAQAKRARDAGCVVGFYHFLWPGNIEAQAEYFVAKCASAEGDLLFVDWENTSSGTRASGAEKDAFIRAVQRLRGKTHRVGLYCNRDFWLNHDSSSFAGDGLWIADYNGNPGHPGIKAPWVFHQYTSKPVDTNLGNFASRAALRTWAAGTGSSTEDDMPQYVNLGLDKPFTLRPGQDWDAIEFTKEWNDEAGDHANDGSVFVRGAARFAGQVSLVLSGVPVGTQFQVRQTEVDSAGKHVADHPIAELIGSEGGTFGIVPVVGRLAKGRQMRIRIKAFQDTPVTVTSAVLTALVWKEG